MKRDFPKLIEEWIRAEVAERVHDDHEIEVEYNPDSEAGPDFEIFFGRKPEGVDRENYSPWLLSEELHKIAVDAPDQAEAVASALEGLAEMVRSASKRSTS